MGRSKNRATRRRARHRRREAEATCAGKVRYGSEITAIRKAAELGKYHYRCHVCGCYHLKTRL